MPEPLIERESTILRELIQMSVERAKAESGSKTGYTTATEAAETEFQQKRQQIVDCFQSAAAREEKAYQTARQGIVSTYQTEHTSEESEYQRTRTTLVARFESARRKAKKKTDEI